MGHTAWWRFVPILRSCRSGRGSQNIGPPQLCDPFRLLNHLVGQRKFKGHPESKQRDSPTSLSKSIQPSFWQVTIAFSIYCLTPLARGGGSTGGPCLIHFRKVREVAIIDHFWTLVIKKFCEVQSLPGWDKELYRGCTDLWSIQASTLQRNLSPLAVLISTHWTNQLGSISLPW